MIKSRWIDRIACIIIALTLLVTVLFCCGERLGIGILARSIGYEDRLFDRTRVHTIDLVVADWEGFLASCTDEEYILCDIVIDGEAVENVALRAKGNTSLSSVDSYGNDRYSFKIEFDQYETGKTYHGNRSGRRAPFYPSGN